MDAFFATQGPASAATAPPPARWQRWADRLARYGWLVLVAAVAVALIGGVIAVATWQPGGAPPPVDEYLDPPCFGGGGLPSARDLPLILPLLGYLLAIVLGLPGLLAGACDLLCGRPAAGSRRLLPFVGPVLVLTGMEIVPHIVNPCALSWLLGHRWLPGLCAYNPDWGGDFAARWHALGHALVGGLPLAALYTRALRHWHPALTRRGCFTHACSGHTPARRERGGQGWRGCGGGIARARRWDPAPLACLGARCSRCSRCSGERSRRSPIPPPRAARQGWG